MPESIKSAYTWPVLAGYAVIAFALAIASVWPIDSWASCSTIIGHAMLLFFCMWLFIHILPRYFSLPIQVMIAMLTGVLAGWIMTKLGAQVFLQDYLGIFGRLFILLLTLVIIPLIFVSVLNGTFGIGDPRKLGSLGIKCLLFYFCTTAIAVLIGLTVVNVLQPGKDREMLQETVAPSTQETGNISVPDITNALVRIGMLQPEEGVSHSKISVNKHGIRQKQSP